MLPKKNRVDRSTLAFLLARKPLMVAQNDHIRMVVYKDVQHDHPRFCFIAPKKKYKHAVTRHLLKRRCSSSLEKGYGCFKKGYIYVFFFQSKVTPSQVTIRASIDDLLMKINKNTQ